MLFRGLQHPDNDHPRRALNLHAAKTSCQIHPATPWSIGARHCLVLAHRTLAPLFSKFKNMSVLVCFWALHLQIEACLWGPNYMQAPAVNYRLQGSATKLSRTTAQAGQTCGTLRATASSNGVLDQQRIRGRDGLQ